MSTPIAGFHVCHESEHWKLVPQTDAARVVIGLYYPTGGADYEFSVVWSDRWTFGTIRLHDDGFAALTDPRFARFWSELAAWGRAQPDGSRNISPAEVVSILGRSGLADLTERAKP